MLSPPGDPMISLPKSSGGFTPSTRSKYPAWAHWRLPRFDSLTGTVPQRYSNQARAGTRPVKAEPNTVPALAPRAWHAARWGDGQLRCKLLFAARRLLDSFGQLGATPMRLALVRNGSGYQAQKGATSVVFIMYALAPAADGGSLTFVVSSESYDVIASRINHSRWICSSSTYGSARALTDQDKARSIGSWSAALVDWD
ncbi:hypothetical protein BJV78DRAFT_1157005 [Lactifluus subvellereus]|nr:hypothetical protein BJV78DRAFT_1157005 [Lactifluus subvellereus]